MDKELENFFCPYPGSIFSELFLCPWSLGRPKSVSGDVFEHTDLIGTFKKNICISLKNRLFSKGLVQGFWSKMAKF